MKKLDFGCGNGGYPGGDAVHPRDRGSWLEKCGDTDTVAIDIDFQAVKEARRRIGRDIHIMAADGKHLPFADGSFDYVREWGVLHHIPNYAEALDEIARVLKKGGAFMACETVDNDPLYAFCRTIVGNWKGARIESRFTSAQLMAEVGKRFHIEAVQGWYRPLIIDIPCYYRESYPGWIVGLYWQYYASRIYSKFKLLPRFARHVTVTAVRK